MLKFNRETFFEEFKSSVLKGKPLKQSLVGPLNQFLDFIERDTYVKSIYQFAYIMATAWHETAFTFKPIKEYGGNDYFVKRYWTNVSVRNDLGNKSKEDAINFAGSGLVQLTGRNNYTRATKELRKQRPDLVAEFEYRTGQTFDLVKYPKQAMDPQIAYGVMTLGMMQGWFGKKLATTVTDTKHSFTHYKSARGSVNGTDKDDEIANYALEFEKVLIICSKITAVASPVQEFTEGTRPVGDKADAPATQIDPNTAETPTGVGSWALSVKGWYAALGLGSFTTIVTGVSEFFSKTSIPLIIWQIAGGIIAFCVVAALVIWVIQFVGRQVEKFQNKRIAYLMTLKEMEIRSDPTKFNVEVRKSQAVMKDEGEKVQDFIEEQVVLDELETPQPL